MQMTDRAGTADYIIIGGGPAGCVLANRLSADPDVRVLLLEAGGSDRHPLFHMPAGFAKMTKGIASWGWSTVPQRHLGGRVLWYTQGKVIGGGSSINAQVYTRGNRRDYDGWGIPGLELPRGTALFQAGRGQPALRRSLSRLWRTAGRLRTGQSPAGERGLPARRAGARHSLQRRLQRQRTRPGSGITR